MIKLTRISFSVDENIQKRSQEALLLYEEAVRNAKLMNAKIPKKPNFNMKPEEFIQKEAPYGIRLCEISDVGISTDNFTAIEKTNGDIVAVKETVEEVIALIEAEEIKFFENKC